MYKYGINSIKINEYDKNSKFFSLGYIYFDIDVIREFEIQVKNGFSLDGILYFLCLLALIIHD